MSQRLRPPLRATTVTTLGRAKFNCGNLLMSSCFRRSNLQACIAAAFFRALSLDAAKRRIVSRYLFTLYILCPKSANTIP